MPSPDTLAALSINPFFAFWGKPAIYTAPGGATTPCLVILDRKDAELALGRGQPMIEGRTIEVRASEVGDLKSARGGTFTIVATSEILKIVEDPRCEDPDRLIWLMTVR